MEKFFETKYGYLVHGDNVEVMQELESSSFDSCISDFPYAIEFMGKQWDSNKNWNQGNDIHGQFQGTGYSGKKRPAFYANTKEDMLQFYDWCYERAVELFRILKPGGYAAIFGHPKANHRMKCAFEDAGFDIVEEIDWLYLTGFPKNQDIEKLADKANKPEIAEKFNGYKTSGLKPAHEPITVFQKPLEGTYLQNIEKYGCGAMNIDACRVPMSEEDADIINAKASKNPTRNYSTKDGKIYGAYGHDKASPANDLGRFPPNIVMDESIAEELDNQTGITKSTGGSGIASTSGRDRHIYGTYQDKENQDYGYSSLGGYGDIGGGSRMFPIFNYSAKVSPSERELPNGIRNPHVTVKPVELIKWIIKLLTPIGGNTIDITAGSGTHGVATEQLNYDEKYNLHWVNIELMNTESDPYCDVAKLRIENANKGKAKKLF